VQLPLFSRVGTQIHAEERRSEDETGFSSPLISVNQRKSASHSYRLVQLPLFSRVGTQIHAEERRSEDETGFSSPLISVNQRKSASHSLLSIHEKANGPSQAQEIPPGGALHPLHAASLAGQRQGALSQAAAPGQLAPVDESKC
jgi:hypothetical protein